MAEDTPGNGRITVSEDRLRLIVSEFKNEILEEMRKHATTQALEALEKRVKSLELWQAAVAGKDSAKKIFTSAAFAWVTLGVACLGFVATIYWLKAK